VDPTRLVFDGDITGVGTRSGHRLVIGRWARSPFGELVDVMHEAPDGHRRLLAPRPDAADLIAATYEFDTVEVVPVSAQRTEEGLCVVAGDLWAEIGLGDRTALGWLLRAVPRPLARSRWWCTAIDPVARRLVPGVRTRGTAGGGRTEWYGATDQRRVTTVRATLGRDDLGPLAPVEPPVRFGFSSSPSTPSWVALRTTIALR
jgi:hypothetical protein